jgi:hypothetical protein
VDVLHANLSISGFAAILTSTITIFGILLLLLSRGMQLNPNTPDQIAGLILHLTTIVLLCLMLFYWSKTSIAAPRRPKSHVRVLIRRLTGLTQARNDRLDLLMQMRNDRQSADGIRLLQ